MSTNKLPSYFQSDFSAGQITDINETIRPRNSVSLGLNVDFDHELGSAVTRLGTFIVGGQMVAGNSILGLHNFTTPTPTSKLFSAINDIGGATAVIYDEAGDVVVTGLTASRKVRFLTYLGSMLAINGVDAERAWNGSAWITTGGAFDLANFPGSNGNHLCAEFLDRVYAAGDTAEPDRLYYSNVPTAGAITWPGGDAGNVDIEAEDGGGGITALDKVPGYLLIFKARSLHRWNFETTFPESLVSICTPSQESVIAQAGIVGFFSASARDIKGFYVTNGGRPVPISHLRTKNIARWVDAIPNTAYDSVAGWGDENHLYWSVGDLTIDKQVYRNVVFRWSIKTGEWCVRTYPTKFTVGTQYLNGEGEVVLVAGDNNGHVIEINKPDTFTDYVTVSGETGYTAIPYDLRTYQEKFRYNQTKSLTDRIVVSTRNGAGAVPYVIVNCKQTVNLASIVGDTHEAQLTETLTGNYFEFGVRGTVQGMRTTIKEIEVPGIVINQNFQ